MDNGKSTLSATRKSTRIERPGEIAITRDGSLSVPVAGVAAWYMLAYSKDLKAGKVLSADLHGRELVLYRGEKSKRAFALSAHCSHMGIHLQHASVVGDEVRCPMHHWQYAGDGSCVAAPGEPDNCPPAFARQRSFPVVERFGAIFVYNGKSPHFDIPQFDGLDETRCLFGQTSPVDVDAHWVPVAVNGFDGLHLSSVHHRALRGAPTIEKPGTDALRLSWHADPVGTHMGDRVTRLLARGLGVRVSITNQGGMLYMIESRVGKLPSSRLLLGLEPRDNRTIVRAIFPVAKNRIPGVARIRVAVQTWLIRRFLEPDARILERSRFRPRLPFPEGEPMADALEFLDTLQPAR